MPESNHVPDKNHFRAGQNMNLGSPKGLEGTRSGQQIVDFLRRFRSGRLTAAGAGDEAVAFTEEMDTDNVTVILTSDTVLAVPIIKNGTTPDKTGFTATVAAACELHWFAFDDGPTS